MTNWDQRMMDLARHIAGWSKDPSTKVGAVICDDLHVVSALGYNGFPRGIPDKPETYADRETKYQLIVHAEANAILNATKSVRGATLYCTLCTCNECAKLVIQAGIRRVVVPRLEGAAAERWSHPWGVSCLMYKHAGVEVSELDG